VKHRKKAEFLARIADAFRNDPIPSTSNAVTAVFELLSHKISEGEIEDVRQKLPADIRALWPIRLQATAVSGGAW
jgi:uncharacterized protein (DUF2267 family)